MRMARWRHAAAIAIAAVAPWVQATDLPAQPPPAAAPPAASGPSDEASDTASWVSGLLAPLRQFGVESWWDVFQFQPWTGSIGFTFDDQEQRIHAPGSQTQVFSSRLWSESATITNDGFAIIDPRLFTASLGLGVTFQQASQQSFGVDQSERATLANYSFDGTFLPESPYNLNLFAQRTQNTYVQPSGSTTHSDISNQGIVFRLHENSILRDKEWLPYFTANFGVYQQYDHQTTTLGGQSFVQNDRRDQILLGFQNGTETSDLNFQYQYTRLDNYAYTAGSYDSQTANVFYSVDFGPTLNWRSDSRVNYYARTGVTEVSNLDTLDVNEYLAIDHNADLSSNYNYQLTRQSAPIGNATTQSAGMQVNEQVFRNLSLTEGITAIYSSLPGGSISSVGAAANFNYGHAVPWEGQLSLGGGGGYLVTSSQVPSGVVPVVDAPYVVPPDVGAGSTILLRDRNIEAQTIVVVVLKAGGVRVPAMLDVDYTLQVNGDRTSLVPLPTSAVMQPGDLLNVSYSYQVSPSSKFQTVSGSASFGMDWPWFGFNYSHDENNQTPLSGGDSALLVSERRDAGVVYVRGVWDTFQARVDAGLVNYDTPLLAYVERRFNAFLGYHPYENLQFNLAANQSRTDYQQPVHVTTTNAVRLDAQWSWGQWQTSGYASWRSYTDTEQPSETVTEGGFRIRRMWTKLDVNLVAVYQQRTKGDITSPNAIVHVNVIRRF
jgi:hypothetical protein